MQTVTFRQPEQTLISNGFALSSAPNRLGNLIPTDANESIDTIRQLFRQQGYVWLRGFFDRDQSLPFGVISFAPLKIPDCSRLAATRQMVYILVRTNRASPTRS